MHLGAFIVLVSCVLITTEHTTVTPATDGSVDQVNTTTTKPLIVKSTDKEKTLPKETQMAQCTVTSGDIKASAQATFSKKLEGFCSTEDMIDLRDQLTKIESRLHNEFYALRSMVRSLMPRDNYYNEPSHQRRYNDYDDRRSYDYQPPRRYDPPAPRDDYYRNEISRNDPPRQETYRPPPATTTQRPETTTKTEVFTTPAVRRPEVVNVMKLKSLDTGKARKNISAQTATPDTSTRPTTTESPQVPTKNEYTYYWKLENFPKVFIYAKKNEVFSHVFNVKGLFLRIRASMNDIDDENLLLDIEHLANIDSEKMEIEISDGLVFQEIAEEKLFQYSFAVMDQFRPNHDLISPIYWNTDTDNFLVPNSVHLLANYVKNDSLLIKLVISF